MYLYIFRPHSEWEYCGGAYIIIAPDFATAATLLQRNEAEAETQASGSQPVLITQNEDPPAAPHFFSDWWVLLESFPVAEQPPRVVLGSYNYA